RVLGDVGDEGGTARAVVVTRTPEDSDRQVVQLPVRHEALQSQRTLRELELDVAEGLAAAEGADPAIEAGVITGDLVAEPEAVAVAGLALREEFGLLHRGPDQMQRLRRWWRRAYGRLYRDCSQRREHGDERQHRPERQQSVAHERVLPTHLSSSPSGPRCR